MLPVYSGSCKNIGVGKTVQQPTFQILQNLFRFLRHHPELRGSCGIKLAKYLHAQSSIAMIEKAL